MSNPPEIRWKQRFSNLDRAFALLRSAVEDKPLDGYSMLEQEGIIQRFQYTFELAWKTIKDYLEEGGISLKPVTPRNVVKEAYSAGLIEDGQVWIDIIDHRNMLSHTYDFEKFREVLMALERRYMGAFAALRESLLSEIERT